MYDIQYVTIPEVAQYRKEENGGDEVHAKETMPGTIDSQSIIAKHARL
jgi:hypothetical protein